MEDFWGGEEDWVAREDSWGGRGGAELRKGKALSCPEVNEGSRSVFWL